MPSWLEIAHPADAHRLETLRPNTGAGASHASVEAAARLMRAKAAPWRISVGHDRALVVAEKPDGFDLSLAAVDGAVFVQLGGWYDEFSDASDALALIEDALAGRVRLKVDSVGGRPAAWTVERLSDAGWREAYAGGVFRLRLWREVECRYFQN